MPGARYSITCPKFVMLSVNDTFNSARDVLWKTLANSKVAT